MPSRVRHGRASDACPEERRPSRDRREQREQTIAVLGFDTVGIELNGKRDGAVEVAEYALPAVYAALGIVDDLLPGDSDCVFLGLNLQLILLEAGQLHDGQNLVALLKDVDGWEGALAGSLVLKPLASGAGFKRSLEVKKGVERVGVCCVHDRTQVWGDFENGKT